MQVISAREFRANQTKILSAARAGQTIMLTSRVGNFKIVPVSDTDRIVESDIRAALSEVKAHLHSGKELPLAKNVEF
ncbi:MAG: type II toxin-antitoxin system prevent-host-death family antitoxin [Muribaculaceae bacterium]|nr:type II toxin-antitoxin system prevent-host-death family antitoxin [Muribaculaceae bacterium]